MMLDPQARAYLDKLASLRLPDFHTMPPPEARRLYRTMRGLGPRPDPVESVEDRIIHGTVPIPIRSYRPLGSSSGPLPALVFFHGGGWVLGDLETVDNLCRRLANGSGCAVVSVEYRVSPEAKFPLPLDDCCEATRHVVDHAASLGIDPRRVAVGGDSAGGNLASGVALRAKRTERLAHPLAFQLLIYPIADHSFETASYREYDEGYGLSREMMAWYWDQYLARPEDGQDSLASPLRADDLAGLPPALVVTAGHDVLRDEGRALADRLEAAGVRVFRREDPGMIHGYFQMADAFDRARLALAEAGSILGRALGSEKG